MDLDTQVAIEQPPPPPNADQQLANANTSSASSASPRLFKDPFRELQVKVHVRRHGKDMWTYVGRCTAAQEILGQSSRIVIRQISSGRVLAVFSELSDVQIEKRGNFIILATVEPEGVVSWSLNALNNSETLKLLASVELACYRCGLALSNPGLHGKVRRRIEKLVKEDRRRRHKRRREDDDLVTAFDRQTIT